MKKFRMVVEIKIESGIDVDFYTADDFVKERIEEGGYVVAKVFNVEELDESD